MTTGELFDDPAPDAPDAPLAERMRPRTLDEFVGQEAPSSAPGLRYARR